MKLFLTTAVLAAVLSTGAFAQGATKSLDEQAAPQGQSKVSNQPESAGTASGAKASGGAMMNDNKAATSGAGTPKDTGSKDAPGDKTGVSGGAK